MAKRRGNTGVNKTKMGAFKAGNPACETVEDVEEVKLDARRHQAP